MVAFEAMQLAFKLHKNQLRKYTGNPYTDHLAEVVGISMSVGWRAANVHPEEFMAVGWLHDAIEDQGAQYLELLREFGGQVADGVIWLTDDEKGSRAERQAAAVRRLHGAPGWVQTIKVADLMSNTSSIVRHDPNFAVVYLSEKRALLDALTMADRQLVDAAWCELARSEAMLNSMGVLK